VLRPGYLVPLVEADTGRTMLAFGLTSLVVGVIVMRRLARVEV
jgi:Flp pilus assembly protein TadB